MRTQQPEFDAAGLDAFVRLLADPVDSWRSTVLDIATVLEELASWRFSSRRRSRYDEISLIADYQASINSLGRTTRSHLKGRISRLNKALMSSERDRTRIHSLTHDFLTTLTDPALAAAAWDDFLDAIARENVEDVTTRLRHLLGILAACGHDLSSLGIRSTLRYILSGHQPYIDHAYAEVGQESVQQPSTAQRVSLCRALISLPITPANNVVWLTYVRATSHRNTWKIGQFHFYKASWVASSCRDKNDDFSVLPPEAQQHPEHFSENLREDTFGHSVLVRVELPETSSADAVAIAKQGADAILTISGAIEAGAWQYAEALHFVDGAFLFQTSQSPDFVQERHTWERNRASINMINYASTVFGDHFIPTSELTITLTILKRLRSLAKVDAPEAPALLVRLLEHLNLVADSSMDWWRFVDEVFSSGWVWTAMMSDLISATRQVAEEPYIERWLRPGVERDTFDAIANSLPESGIRVSNVHVFADAAVSFGKMIDPKWLSARILRRAAHILSDSETTRRRCRERYEDEFTTRIDRLKRYRNIATHGGEVSLIGSRSVFELTKKLGRVVFEIHVTSATKQTALRSLLDEHTSTSKQKLDAAEDDRLEEHLWKPAV